MSDETHVHREVEGTTLTIRMPRAMRQAIKRRAEIEERSESQVIRFYLSQALDLRKSTSKEP